MINLGRSLHKRLGDSLKIDELYLNLKHSVDSSLREEVRDPFFRHGDWQNDYSMELFAQRINSK